MRLINKFLYLFFFLCPAFLAAGKSQLPIWPILIVTNFFNVKLRVNDSIFLILIFTFYISSIFAQTINDSNGFINNFYYIKQLMLLTIALLISRKVDLQSIWFSLIVACTVSFIVGTLEMLIPNFCNMFTYVNAVRPCSGIRVSAFYNEPSHIAFLFFTCYVYLNLFGGPKWVYFLILLAGILFFSMSYVTLLGFVFIHRLFQKRSGATVFLFIFLAYSLVSILYLVLRDYGYLPIQQSWDKRNLFFINSFFDLDWLLVYPFFTERQFLYDGWFQALSSSNFEIMQVSKYDVVYSLSLLGGLVWSIGPLAVLWVVLKLLRSPSIFGLSVSALLLGFPAALFVLVALFAVDRIPKERN